MIGPSKIIFEEESESEEMDNQRQHNHQNQQFHQNQSHNQALNQSYAQNQEEYREDPEYEEQLEINNEKSFYELGIPLDSYATLKGHNKAVSCVAVEPKGHRMATGGLDYHVRLWDFHGMNKNMNSFRIIEPFTGNAIRNINFNKTGSHLMLINGGKQITCLDRDGAKNMLTVKGYMYVKELHGTKGHTNTIYDGQFHPINANQFISASGDGSIRMWDLQQKLEGIEQELGHKILLKCKDDKSLMTGVTGVCYTNDGKMIFGGCMDGSLQGFSTKHNHHRPEMVVRDAHKNQEQYTSIVSFEDSMKIVTRNMDSTLKVWDLRMFNKPILYYSNLPNYFPGSKVCFSPNYEYLLVGTSIGIEADQKQAYVHVFDSTTYEKLKTVNMGSSSVTGLAWNKEINQIIVGTGAGQARIYFDERLSVRGALKSINKQPRVDKDPKFDYSAPVYLPHSLPIYKERPTNNIKKDLEQMRRNPILSAKPHIPIQGPNKGGRRNDVAYTQIQHVIQSLNANPEKVDDARKPLWEIQKFTKEKQQFTGAYAFTQPNPVFHESPVEEKEFTFLHTLKKICPHCGLKLCKCEVKYVYEEKDEEEEKK